MLLGASDDALDGAELMSESSHVAYAKKAWLAIVLCTKIARLAASVRSPTTNAICKVPSGSHPFDG